MNQWIINTFSKIKFWNSYWKFSSSTIYEVYIFSQYGNKFILNIILLQTFSESQEQNQELWNSFN